MLPSPNTLLPDMGSAVAQRNPLRLDCFARMAALRQCGHVHSVRRGISVPAVPRLIRRVRKRPEDWQIQDHPAHGRRIDH
jgi:hypothetical protein